jgi:hypothetical protein
LILILSNIAAEFEEEHASSTSNICGRLFSRAKLVLSALRKRTKPDTLNTILFLTANKKYWPTPTIMQVVVINSVPDDTLDDSEESDCEEI